VWSLRSINATSDELEGIAEGEVRKVWHAGTPLGQAGAVLALKRRTEVVGKVVITSVTFKRFADLTATDRRGAVLAYLTGGVADPKPEQRMALVEFEVVEMSE
jgi:hypothetical protein